MQQLAVSPNQKVKLIVEIHELVVTCVSDLQTLSTMIVECSLLTLTTRLFIYSSLICQK